jgi:dTDP-L-rhamnose 4-epimerase
VFVLEEPRADGQVFNVGTGRATSIVELAGLLQEALGRTGRVEVPGRFRPGEVRHMISDPGKLAALGFRAETTVREGLRQYVEWLSQQGPIPEMFSEAERQLQTTGIVRSGAGR